MVPEAEIWKFLELVMIKGLHCKMKVSIDPNFILSARCIIGPFLPSTLAVLELQANKFTYQQERIREAFSAKLWEKRTVTGEVMHITKMSGTFHPRTWRMTVTVQYNSSYIY